jgi:hypothetical protein
MSSKANNNVSSLNHNMASLSVNGNTMSSSNGDNASASSNINNASSNGGNNAYGNRDTPSNLINGVWYYPADPSIDIHMFGFYYLPDPGDPYYRDVAWWCILLPNHRDYVYNPVEIVEAPQRPNTPVNVGGPLYAPPNNAPMPVYVAPLPTTIEQILRRIPAHDDW